MTKAAKKNVDWCIQHLGNYCYPNVDQILKNESFIKLWVKIVAGLFFVGAKVSPQTTFEKSSFSLEKRQGFLDKIKVGPRIASLRFGKMIEV